MSDKQCTKCKEFKKLEEFHKDNRRENAFRARCKKCHSIAASQYYNIPGMKIAFAESNKKWRQTPNAKVSQSCADKRRALTPEGRAKLTAKVVRRDLDKLKRTPKWLTIENHREIEQKYIEAQRKTIETGIPHQVDHIVPLRGKMVSGLHVPWNLQILTRSENGSKGNKIVPIPQS